ncbi:MAG: hypothetical protein RL367_170, partial [Pseudomonadota bacterium]
GDDPVAIVESIRLASGSEAMPMTDTIDKSGMVQAVGSLVAAKDRSST